MFSQKIFSDQVKDLFGQQKELTVLENQVISLVQDYVSHRSAEHYSYFSIRSMKPNESPLDLFERNYFELVNVENKELQLLKDLPVNRVSEKMRAIIHDHREKFATSAHQLMDWIFETNKVALKEGSNRQPAIYKLDEMLNRFTFYPGTELIAKLVETFLYVLRDYNISQKLNELKDFLASDYEKNKAKIFSNPFQAFVFKEITSALLQWMIYYQLPIEDIENMFLKYEQILLINGPKTSDRLKANIQYYKNIKVN